MIYDKEWDGNLKVCPKCQYHFPIGARERIHALVETCSFEENDPSMESVDVLKFTGVSSYISKLEHYKKTTGLKDAVCTSRKAMRQLNQSVRMPAPTRPMKPPRAVPLT